MADTLLTPPSGSITATGVVAAMAMSLTFVPTVGSWSASGAAPAVTQQTSTAIAPAAGGITLVGVASTIAKPTVTGITPTVGALALAGVASTVSQQDAPTVTLEGIGQGTAVWNLVNGQSGTRFPSIPGYETVFTQVTGTFGSGGSVQMEGSNDGFNWVKLSPTALTSAGFFAALGANERPKYVRPNCTAGDTTTNLTVTAWFSS